MVFSIWVLLDVLVFKFTGGLAKPSYDAMVRARVYAAAPDPRIVIVDIDEASLARMGKEFGRWPKGIGNDPGSPACRAPPELLREFGLLKSA